ncbi:hypothetical protein [Methanoculleus methanifontis]|uniref:hypothetical protein n=1 Tax=Methanoculleus methanifontis TaxID=2584086 RepID=UPI0026597C79|nr:hypothetical protein [Methanoculleus sp. FWC-SCC3]
MKDLIVGELGELDDALRVEINAKFAGHRTAPSSDTSYYVAFARKTVWTSSY